MKINKCLTPWKAPFWWWIQCHWKYLNAFVMFVFCERKKQTNKKNHGYKSDALRRLEALALFIGWAHWSYHIPHFGGCALSSVGEVAKEDIPRNSNLLRGGLETKLLCVDVFLGRLLSGPGLDKSGENSSWAKAIRLTPDLVHVWVCFPPACSP